MNNSHCLQDFNFANFIHQINPQKYEKIIGNGLRCHSVHYYANVIRYASLGISFKCFYYALQAKEKN